MPQGHPSMSIRLQMSLGFDLSLLYIPAWSAIDNVSAAMNTIPETAIRAAKTESPIATCRISWPALTPVQGSTATCPGTALLGLIVDLEMLAHAISGKFYDAHKAARSPNCRYRSETITAGRLAK